jgi:NADH:ubiquinone oxidoreductase subunit E
MDVGFNTLILAARKPVFHYQPSDEDVELSALPAPCLPGCCHAPTLMIMDGTSEPVSQHQLNIVLIMLPWSWCLFTALKPLRQEMNLE